MPFVHMVSGEILSVIDYRFYILRLHSHVSSTLPIYAIVKLGTVIAPFTAKQSRIFDKFPVLFIFLQILLLISQMYVIIDV